MVVGRNQPAKRFPLVQPLFHETYQQAMYRQRLTTNHWRRIDYAKPMVDDGPPKAIINPRLKLKKILAKGMETARIERHNKFLLRNIIGVMKGPSVVDHYFKVPANARPNSLNIDLKKQWVHRVNTENKAMLRRIINTRTMFDHLEMEKDYQHKIRSNRGRRDVFALWNSHHRRRRYWIMSGECEYAGITTDMEELRTRTAKTHSRCCPPDQLEPFHSTEVPRRSRSPPGAPRVDHHRCFSLLPFKPSARSSPQRTAAILKKSEKNINQSASTSYSRSYREACTKDSPYQADLHLDKLGSVAALPPIGKSSKPNQRREEKAWKDGKECNKLPNLPSCKLSKEVSAFRPCALRVSDTSLSAPCWKPVIPSCSERVTCQNGSQVEKNLRDAYGQTIKRFTVTSLPRIIPNRGTDGLAVSTHSSKTSTDSASSSKSVKVCPKERMQKLHVDVGKSSHHGNAETASGQLAHSLETFSSSAVASQKNRVMLSALETKRRAEQQEAAALPPSRTHSMASRQTTSEPGTNQKSSADKKKPQPEKNQTKNNPQLLRVKRSSRKNSTVNFERDDPSALYPPVTRQFLMPISEGKDVIVIPTCSDPFPSFKLLKKKEALANRTQENELSLPKSNSPRPKTSTRNDEREIPEEISQQVIPPLTRLKESTTSDPSLKPESNDPPGLSSEKLELCSNHSPSPDPVPEDSEEKLELCSNHSPSPDPVPEDSEDDTVHEDVEEPPRPKASARDGNSQDRHGSSCPSPLSDVIQMVAAENHYCGLPDWGVLHCLGLDTQTFSTEQGAALDRLIFSEDSDEEECADDASVSSEED